jgi:hypothetical protein
MHVRLPFQMPCGSVDRPNKPAEAHGLTFKRGAVALKRSQHVEITPVDDLPDASQGHSKLPVEEYLLEPV